MPAPRPSIVPTNFGEGFHILVTGGNGFVGSHTVLRLLEEGFIVTVIDNNSGSNPECLSRVRSLVSPMQSSNLYVHDLDLCDMLTLKATMMAITGLRKVDACLHFAGLRSVGESTRSPLKYHQNNVTGTLNLLEALSKHGVRQIVFSSSATVYGNSPCPLTEKSNVGAGITNPYGRGKFIIEQIFEDLHRSPGGREWGIISLRYFNPVGAHPSGRIGEDPTASPNNLMPYVAQVAMGRREFIAVGNDFKTPDGTSVRDYIHVMDLAEGHLAALKKLQQKPKHYAVYNLGIGNGISVREMIDAMERASGLKITVRDSKKRPGDIAVAFVDSSKAKKELGWAPKYDIDRMCKDLWRWINANPCGYEKPDKEFGAFKQATFQSSSMPTLSSASRRPSRNLSSSSGGGGSAAKPPQPPLTPSRRPSSSSSMKEDFGMRGRGTSMDDLLAAGATGDDVEFGGDDPSIPFRGRGTSMDDLLSGGGGGSSGSGANSTEVGVGESF